MTHCTLCGRPFEQRTWTTPTSTDPTYFCPRHAGTDETETVVILGYN